MSLNCFISLVSYILGIVEHTYPVKVFRQKAIIVILPSYDKNWRSYENDYMVTEILTRTEVAKRLCIHNHFTSELKNWRRDRVDPVQASTSITQNAKNK